MCSQNSRHRTANYELVAYSLNRAQLPLAQCSDTARSSAAITARLHTHYTALARLNAASDVTIHHTVYYGEYMYVHVATFEYSEPVRRTPISSQLQNAR